MKTIFIFLLLLIVQSSFSQIKDIGTPRIINYPKTVYNSGTQNWSIVQGDHNIMFFGNNNGVLVFNGQEWTTINVSNTSPIRSLGVDIEGQIYVGLYNDFGKIIKNKKGIYEYKSLVGLINSEVSEIGEIWKIHMMDYGVVFQSFNGVYTYSNDKISVIYPRDHFHFSFKVNDHLYVQEPSSGLYEIVRGTIYKVPWDNLFTNMEIWAMHPFNDAQMLIGTKSNGLFKYENGKLSAFKSEVNDFLIKNNIFSSVKIGPGLFAFGTILDGIVFTNLSGEIIQHINKKKGLINNTILSTYIDDDNNLWMGLDNGISYVEINSPISFLNDFNGIGAGYAAVFYENDLYVGTNQGLFKQNKIVDDCSASQFTMIEGTAGQVWSLAVLENQLLCGHNNGTYKIEKNKAKKISDYNGAWNFIQSKQNPDYMISGNYNGILIFKNGINGWKEYKKLENFYESSRFIEEDMKGDLWVSHGAKGVIKLKLSKEYKKIDDSKWFNAQNGLPSNEQNIVHQIDNQIFVSNIDGLYTYNKDLDKFEKDEPLGRKINTNGWLKKVVQDKDENVWFITESELGVLRMNEDRTYTKITKPFTGLESRLVNSFEFIYPFSDTDVFIGIDEGFAHYSSEIQKSYNKSFPVMVTSIAVSNLDTIIYCPSHITDNARLVFPYQNNELRFNYTAPFYEDIEGMLFSYRIMGFNENWSEWSDDSYRDITNLREGEYSFQVKAVNKYGIENISDSFTFVIKPPWFRSLPAYIIYSVLFMTLVLFISYYTIRRLEKTKLLEKQKHQEQLEIQEKEHKEQSLIAEKQIIKLRNDKLRSEMIHRDKELANQTMGIIQKNKLLAKITDELNSINRLIADEKAKSKISLLKTRISKELDNKEQKQLFETYFDEVHEDFFERLKEKFPQLTPNDLRLCAFVKMNISTKEIAAILNISYRGAEISRYRLRKKMELSRDVNLSSFLSNI